MAEFIPDRLPGKASRGEERTFEILKKLPDNYLVYYEPNIENRRPDFVVIAPDLGVIVIEVKGWRIEDIIQGSDSEITVQDNDGRPRREIHPLDQARNYQWKLVRACGRNPRFSELLHRDGPHKNKFIFPFAHFVILSNITDQQLRSYRGLDFSIIFRPENTMTKDGLMSLLDASPTEIAAQLKTYFDPYWNITPLSQNQIDVLRAIIHPEIIISYLPSSPLVVAEPQPMMDQLKVLDRRQENNARKIGEGHRILCGVAGSGKTVLLISRARFLHDQDPDAKILLLCYNVSLATYLKQVLSGYSNIRAIHFDGWARNNGIYRMRDSTTGTVETDPSLGARFLEHLNKRAGDFRKYDSILIDEAQDFHPTWFSCILPAMKDPDDGDLLIVCDGNQGIRPIETITWKSLGIKASGRSMHRTLDLDKNYRNTREILTLASHFALNESPNTDDSFGLIPVNPAQARRHGPKPYLIRCLDHSDECKHIVQIVKNLLKGQLPDGTMGSAFKPEEIGIIYRRSSAKEKEYLMGLREEISQISPVIWLSENYSTRSQVLEPGVKIQTVDSAKGLQYRAVIILWPDLFRPFNHNDESLEKRRFYVALTRAEDLVVLTSSKSNKNIEVVEKSGDIIRIPSIILDKRSSN
ncbi:MAG TPA: 3'-5' exonuclease [Methanoregulaceae archaeon]|nr:3'-5' exonuclease [Methanoregulaceae archaeon]HNO07719.1 3'-5' exonuclease [Methanoregulaceae archaeon]